MNPRAEIAGAGFAGLAAAAALARRGWTVRVHEMSDAPRSTGAGIYVHPFAQDALRRIDAFDRFRPHAFAPARRHISVDGTVRSTTPVAGLFLTTTRMALHRAVLEAALASGVQVATRSRAIAADPAGFLQMKDGRRLEADLVVAADGTRSALARHMRIPIHRVPHQDGITRVILDREGLRGPEWDDITDLYDYRGRPLRVLYTPCGPDVFYFCMMAPATDAAAAAVPIDPEIWARSFPTLAATFRRIGAAGRHDYYSTTTLPTWSQGKVAVIGDAAHAMPSSLGQGAGVSMMNAIEMAETVATAASVEQGLAAWETALRPVVEQWQTQTEGVASQRSLLDAVHPGEDFAVERTGQFPALQRAGE